MERRRAEARQGLSLRAPVLTKAEPIDKAACSPRCLGSSQGCLCIALQAQRPQSLSIGPGAAAHLWSREGLRPAIASARCGSVPHPSGPKLELTQCGTKLCLFCDCSWVLSRLGFGLPSLGRPLQLPGHPHSVMAPSALTRLSCCQSMAAPSGLRGTLTQYSQCVQTFLP